MSSTNTVPLIAEDPTAIPLYDPESMVLIEKSLAQGFMTLLTGGDPEPLKNLAKNRIRRSAVDMGFLAITEGNILEACFGLPTSSVIVRDRDEQEQAPSATGRVRRARAQVRRVKDLLTEAADANEAICKMTVGTYLKGLEIVISTRDHLDELNFFTRCFYYGRVIRKAKVELKQTFSRLQEPLQTALADKNDGH